MPDEKKEREPEKQSEESKVGQFLTKYATLLSSTVLGIAGLAATSIWQFRQSATAQQQADSAAKVASTQAENSWKIERADILSKNVAVLAASGPATVEQRYGVLLSLTRGNLLDPELAVSYALELGKDSPEDMLSVLANVPNKDYSRFARAYTLSCDDRFGTSPAIDVCNDKLGPRSAALAELFSEDAQTALGTAAPGPLVVLSDEKQVQVNLERDVALFTPLLVTLYEARKWTLINAVTSFSPGAHLVASLALSAARTGEFVTDDEAKQRDTFHATHSAWLSTYLGGKTCDAECKSRMLDVMVSHYSQSFGTYDAAVRALLLGPAAESTMAIGFLHTRLLWCQLDDNDLIPLRDQVLLPAAIQAMTSPTTDPSVRDSLLSLISLIAEPPSTDVAGAASWTLLMTSLDKTSEKLAHTFQQRRQTAINQRKAPPPALKKGNFCAVPDSATGSDGGALPDPSLMGSAAVAPSP